MRGAEVHVIPVPHGMSIEDAWAEIHVMGGFVDFSKRDPRFVKMPWANIRIPEGADPLTEFEVLPVEE